MSQIAFVTDAYVPHHLAATHIEDRGYQFSDGIYEVVAVYNGLNLDEEGHLDRLFQSLQEIDLDIPYTLEHLRLILEDVKRRNFLQNGILYIQVSRGVAPREHGFTKNIEPQLIVTAKHLDFTHSKDLKGFKVISALDERWGRCDIKSIGLLANILAKHNADEKGFNDAWLFNKEGLMTEGTASNTWIVDENNVVRTHPLNKHILRGITRTNLLEIMKHENIAFEEKAFTLDDVKRAREAFQTSASKFVHPVIAIDNHKIGDGAIGKITLKLLELYLKNALQVALKKRK